MNAAWRRELARLGVGLAMIVVLLAALSPLMLPDPWDLIYAGTLGALGFGWLLGKEVLR